ncbi:MAG: hypothetical protein HC771_00425 [Synechococcales cyanobacterium CRU_2_2]|nr:hypothetical protein [Synechococcales cyanobacterium CRU_2_2]
MELDQQDPKQLRQEPLPNLLPEVDHLTEQEVQTAMAAISQIIPVLDLYDCLKIVQWATERAATAQIAAAAQMTTTLPSRQPSLALVEYPVKSQNVESQINSLADELEDDEALPLNLDLSFLDLDSDRWDLSIAPPMLEDLNEAHFSVPTLTLVGEPPEDLPLAM